MNTCNGHEHLLCYFAPPNVSMTYPQQRMLFLSIRLLLLFIVFSFSLAQDSNVISPFTLETSDTVTLCGETVLFLSGGNSTPPYWVYVSRGGGPIGDESSLEPEMFLTALNDTTIMITLGDGWGMSLEKVHYALK